MYVKQKSSENSEKKKTGLQCGNLDLDQLKLGLSRNYCKWFANVCIGRIFRAKKGKKQLLSYLVVHFLRSILHSTTHFPNLKTKWNFFKIHYLSPAVFYNMTLWDRFFNCRKNQHAALRSYHDSEYWVITR